MNLLYAAPLLTPAAAANPWQLLTVAIDSIVPEVEGVATYRLVFQDEAVRAVYRFAPGQFNMLYLPAAGEIAISISDDYENQGSCEHTVHVVGNVTRTLAGLQVGDTLGMRGPFGTCWPLAECIGRDVVIVAGGIGLAPLRPAICTLLRRRRQFGRVTLLYGSRSPDTLLYMRQYDDWAQRGMLIHTTVDRSVPGWLGNVGVVTLLLEHLRTLDPENTVLLCCGPEVMMKYTVMTALRRGLTARQIWVSLERNMQCAVGLCGHCQLGPEFVCKDGPIFRYDRIAPYLDVDAL
jgi:NAD(P)H-flavin reductase